ncbi:MAG: hypothetical protein JWM73_1437, partial [Solirubrobacterales bacterium]|nr:hypothetical protein [Solirubrobacterales bacterium]
MTEQAIRRGVRELAGAVADVG